MLSYLKIIYAYICDLFWFDESLEALELIAVIDILAVVITVAIYKLKLKAAQAKPTSAE